MRGLERPNGASECSHGWRDGAAQPTGAEPVEAISCFSSRPARGEGVTMPGTCSQLLLHAITSAKSELLRVLHAHDVEFDERHVFD